MARSCLCIGLMVLCACSQRTLPVNDSAVQNSVDSLPASDGPAGPQIPCNPSIAAPFSLKPGYCVVAVIDLPTSDVMATFAFDPTTLGTYSHGRAKHAYVVRRHELDLPNNRLGSVIETFGFSVEGKYIGYSLPTDLALSPEGTLAAAFHSCCNHPLPPGGGGGIPIDSGGVHLLGAAPALISATLGNGLAYLDSETLLVGATEVDGIDSGMGIFAYSSKGGEARLLIEGFAGDVAASSTVVLALKGFAQNGFYVDPMERDVYAFSVNEVRRALEEKRTLSAADGDRVSHWTYAGYDGRTSNSLRSIAALRQDLIYVFSSWNKGSDESLQEVWRVRTKLSGDLVLEGSTEKVLSHQAASGIQGIQTFGDLIALRITGLGNSQLVVLKALP